MKNSTESTKLKYLKSMGAGFLLAASLLLTGCDNGSGKPGGQTPGGNESTPGTECTVCIPGKECITHCKDELCTTLTPCIPHCKDELCTTLTPCIPHCNEEPCLDDLHFLDDYEHGFNPAINYISSDKSHWMHSSEYDIATIPDNGQYGTKQEAISLTLGAFTSSITEGRAQTLIDSFTPMEDGGELHTYHRTQEGFDLIKLINETITVYSNSPEDGGTDFVSTELTITAPIVNLLIDMVPLDEQDNFKALLHTFRAEEYMEMRTVNKENCPTATELAGLYTQLASINITNFAEVKKELNRILADITKVCGLQDAQVIGDFLDYLAGVDQIQALTDDTIALSGGTFQELDRIKDIWPAFDKSGDGSGTYHYDDPYYTERTLASIEEYLTYAKPQEINSEKSM